MAPDWHALHGSVKEHVGRSTRQRLGPMSAAQFQRFAVAVGDLNPRYFDPEAAREQGFPGVVAPPLYLTSVLGWQAGPAEDELRPDGAESEVMAGVPLEGVRLMGAGQEVELSHPVCDGTDVTLEVSVDDVELKHGGSGQFLILRLLRRYLDDRGTELMRCRETFIAR
ncbi:MAG: hypothetical protein GEV03_06505 [Streptosporangiales bacterium]|nr:hypothetical protein [Streptosporangiales bacterium]